MGTYIQSNHNLEDRVKELERKIDQNGDGHISKEELNNYLGNQRVDIERWKTEYKVLEDKYNKLLSNQGGRNYVSVSVLKDYIEEILKTDSNLKYIPDPLERRVYLTVMKTIMQSLETLFNTTTLEFLNHEITLNINPISSKKD